VVFYLESDNNWWGPAGKTGPCGPCTEQFYWKDNKIKAPKKFDPSDKRWVEIGNDVLMQYIKCSISFFRKILIGISLLLSHHHVSPMSKN
jgi:alanyl-tRNA synthetase